MARYVAGYRRQRRSHRATLVIFVKAPQSGRVKTRLARDIGNGAALSFYRQTTARVIRRLGHIDNKAGWRIVLAVTPDYFASLGKTQSRFWPVDLPRVAQQTGDLGQRMSCALRGEGKQPSDGPVIVIGSDIPEITARHIRRAVAALRRADIVFGPAQDGGFWLVGIRRGELAGKIADKIFEDVRWSGPHALSDCMKNISGLAGVRVATVDQLSDIDDISDFKAWRARQAK